LRLDIITSVKWEIRPSVGIVAKDVDRLGLDIRSFREPLIKIVRLVMIPSIKKNFSSGGRPPWEPLAADTVKARGYSAWPILERTGRLKRRATQLSIWDIGLTSATVRSLPSDVFYGYYHQAGGGGAGQHGGASALLQHAPGSAGAKALIAKFVPRAIKELGASADPAHIHNRAVGLLLDAEHGSWTLPQRQFIMWQSSDIPKMDLIFSQWMEERARKVGRFRTE
jgi:phage gpG-like protein